jgi:four helix bundle protein
MFKGFRAYELAEELYQECEQLKLKAHLRDQLSRASLSIVLNIAEGTGKPSVAEKRRFYAIAFGSLRETQAILRLTRSEVLILKADRVASNLYPLVYQR